VQLLIALLYLLVEGLVFDLQLLEVDEVKALSELFLFLQDFLVLVEGVAGPKYLQTKVLEVLA